MRFGRLILAGLAPLFSLPAFAAGWIPGAVASRSAQMAPADSLSGLLATVVPLLVSPVDSVSARLPGNGAAHAILALEALRATPFAGSLWLLASLAAVNLFLRRHPRRLLRL